MQVPGGTGGEGFVNYFTGGMGEKTRSLHRLEADKTASQVTINSDNNATQRHVSDNTTAAGVTTAAIRGASMSMFFGGGGSGMS